MKKKGILNSNFNKLIAEMGHKDKLVICDAGLPIPKTTEKIDLAFIRGIPRFLDVLKATLEELVIEEVIMAEEIMEVSPDLYQKTVEVLDDIPITFCKHDKFKNIVSEARGVIRSGEVTPYANIILFSGVNF